MKRLSDKRHAFGKAKTVLVFHEGTDGKAVITQIIATGRARVGRTRIQFRGPMTFEKATVKHIRETIWPIIESILKLLGIQAGGFDVSVTNINAASAKGVGIDIFGLSTDLSVALSLLSAGSGIPVKENMVFTGHIASTDGSIRLVQEIPGKATAVLKDLQSDTLVYPDLNSDRSMDELTPNDKNRIEGALSQVKDRIRTIAVQDVGDLVKAAFTERDILVGSLAGNWFGVEKKLTGDHPTEKAANYLVHGLYQRFWHQLYKDLSQGKSTEAVDLLTAFANYFISNQTYPPDAGQHLYRVVASVPPETRRLKLKFPLMAFPSCMELCRLAGKKEGEDTWLFLKACSGEVASSLKPSPLIEQQEAPEDKGMDQVLGMIISQIESDNFVQSIAIEIDLARATFPMGSVVVCSHYEFYDVIASYYIHLSRHAKGYMGPADMDSAGRESIKILERAYAKRGGFQAAEAEAKHATNGGMRYVLDLMTDQFKQEEKEKHVSWIFKMAMNPLDWDGKVQLMKSLIKHLKHILPSDIADQPAERYAGNFEPIIMALCHSKDKMISIFRSI